MTGSDPAQALQNFAKLIAKEMGLHFPKFRLPELAQKMTSLGREAGYADLQSYMLWLMSAPLSKKQMEVLAGVLTIGETYFLRDPKSYRVFEEELLPDLIKARRSTDKTLRIWSAGCSTGEEPYSIAILLSRVIPDLADWKITLVGSDINPRAIERGRLGIYSKWSFRNAPGWLLEYFSAEPDGSYQIVPRIRNMVRFAHLNLADPGGPSSPLTEGMDIIFCRNVMLYFHAAQIKKTIARFHSALKNGGWLFVGPTEVDHQTLSGFSCRQFDGALVLRKTDQRQEEQLSERPVWLPEATLPQPLQAGAALPSLAQSPKTGASLPSLLQPAATGNRAAARAKKGSAVHSGLPEQNAPSEKRPGSALEEAQALYRAGRYEQAALLALGTPKAAQQAETLALVAHAYANIGRLDEARRYCEKAIARDRLSAQNHYLLSIILEQQGDSDGAVRSLKHALYIDHDYLLAYFALGNLCQQRGEQKKAQQSFANALRLLQRRDPHEVLPEAEGMTAGTLAQLIRSAEGRGGAGG